MTFLLEVWDVVVGTLLDVAPVVLVIFGFQIFVLKKPVRNLKRILVGLGYVVFGLSLFLIGLEKALFPVGKIMGGQLSKITIDTGSLPEPFAFVWSYAWVYLFALAIGFSTTLAEPALIAIAAMAEEVSGGAVGAAGLRVAVSIGVGVGLVIGTFRIVSGWPLHWFIIAGYIFVLFQTSRSPKEMIAIAYDSGGVTTSTVTVPLVAALGLGLAESIPGRNPLIDGFGLIAFASLFPIISVLAYARFARRNSQS